MTKLYLDMCVVWFNWPFIF